MPAQLTIPALKDFLKLVALERKLPVLIHGAPGLGKTESVVQLANEADAVLVDFRANYHDSPDIRGLPEFIRIDGVETPFTIWSMPSVLPFKGNPRFPHDRTIVLLVDEIGSAGAGMFPLLMQLINERRVAEHELMDNVCLVSATNRLSDRGTSVVLPTTVLNRFIHVEAIADRQAWYDWWLAQGGTPMAVAFYEFKKDLFFTFKPEDRSVVAFATPRTNAMAWRLWMDDKLPLDVKRAAMMGAVGDGVTAEIMGFADVWQKVLKTKDILKDPSGVPLPNEESMLYATAVSVSGDMDMNTVDKLDQFLARLPVMYQTIAWHLAMRRTDGKGKDDLTRSDASIRYAKRVHKVF